MTDNRNEPPALTFPSFFFNSGFGYACYYMLRNDWVWSLLNEEEKQFVLKHNEYWNNNNPGYKNPIEYKGQGGKSFSTVEDRCAKWKGRMVQQFLDIEHPKRILEIGPGSGYYTRQIIDCPGVVEYVATDINVKFLDNVKNAIADHPRAQSVNVNFLPINNLTEENLSVDAIVILSALHHIPDRADFVKHLSSQLAPGGALFFYEPTHSINRVLQLIWSFLKNRWFSTKVVKIRNNYMTHHFCTISETRDIAKYSELDLESWDVESSFPLPHLRSIVAPFSKEMIAVLRKNL